MPEFPWRREIRGTRLSWCTIEEWMAVCEEVGRMPRHSSKAFKRAELLYTSLQVDDVRRCADIVVLERLERCFASGRHVGGWPANWSLCRELRRADIAALLVETRNRLDALRSGRAANPRPRGPRFDPRRLPEAALERLIQQHPDLAIVERLRAERARRLEIEGL